MACPARRTRLWLPAWFLRLLELGTISLQHSPKLSGTLFVICFFPELRSLVLMDQVCVFNTPFKATFQCLAPARPS